MTASTLRLPPNRAQPISLRMPVPQPPPPFAAGPFQQRRRGGRCKRERAGQAPSHHGGAGPSYSRQPAPEKKQQ
jgi:hypothetical protein